MGAIIQNGQIGAIIKNGIVYGGAIGGTNISEVLRVTEGWAFFNEDGYTYSIETISTGGYDASILVKEYLNETEVRSVNILYSDASTYTTFNDIYVCYNSNNLKWNVSVNSGKIIKYNGAIYNENDNPIDWSFEISVNYDIIGGTPSIKDLDSDKLYLITNSNGEMIKYNYLGNNRLTRYKTPEEIEDYEFWYEDLVFPMGMSSSSSDNNYYGNYWINSNIKLFSTENIDKNWQIEFNIKAQRGSGSSSDTVILGTPTNSSRYFEFFVSSSGEKLGLYGADYNGTEYCGEVNITNKDVIIKYENKILTVTIDGTLVKTKDLSSRSVDNTNTFYVARYSSSRDYCFNGTMNYIGFKWLTTPTPSGADGLTYSLSVDNNYHLNIIEYDNGVQSQTTSLNDEDLDYGSTPVTFGDLIISYDVNDVFVIKPNYNDNKAIKYNDVVYSGNNEILSLPDYTESSTYTLTGWIE